MTTSNPIHIKVEFNKALEAKKDILGSQLGILKIIKILREYKVLRAEELETKSKAHRKLSELNTIIKKLQTQLPKIKMPKLAKTEEHEEDIKEIIKKKDKKRS